MLNIKDIKASFPLLKHSPKLAYLDSTASTQTAQPALDAMNEYYARYRANVHRGLYDASQQATEKYEAARLSLAKFLNADQTEIIFTPGTTFGLNALARALSPRLSHRDNIVLTRAEHHANLVPWQEMARHYGFQIRFIELTSDFRLDIDSAKKLIDANTKIVSFAAVSNVLGGVAPIKELVALAHERQAIAIVDAAQAAAHLPLDTADLDCDFLVLSGHKMYGPTGIGVLYGKKTHLTENLEPFMFGGDMVADVTYERAAWNEAPYKFEAGTPPIAEAIGFGKAAEFITDIGWEAIMAHEAELVAYALEQLAPLVNIFGPATAERRLGVMSLALPKIHPHDVGEIVNRFGVCIRVGHHCAQPLHKHFGLAGSARASLGVYSTKEDIDRLTAAIAEVKKIFDS